jgi:hypothetical protein
MLAPLAVALTATLLAPGGAAQAATPKVMITKVYVNTPGSDTPATNTKLNGEYIVIKNTTKSTISLSGWTIRDKASTASGHIYKFASTVKIGAGKSITIHTGKGTNTSTNRYWGRSGTSGTAYIWNNSGDTAYLRDSAGKTIDTCTWGTVSSYKTC